jgi:hypothetical protein
VVRGWVCLRENPAFPCVIPLDRFVLGKAWCLASRIVGPPVLSEASMLQVTPEHGNDSKLAIVNYAIGMPINQAMSFFRVKRKPNTLCRTAIFECNLFRENE